MKPFQLHVATLVEALSAAIAFAREENSENYNACCLRIYDDSTFHIVVRTYSNVSFSGKLALSGPMEKDHYDLTVAATDIPAKAWEFGLLEFCARYSIRISTLEVKDIYGNVRPASWEKAA